MTTPFHLRKPTIKFQDGRKLISGASSEYPVPDDLPKPAIAPQADSAKAPFKTRRKIVGGDRALFGQNRATNRSPVAKAEGNWTGAQGTD